MVVFLKFGARYAHNRLFQSVWLMLWSVVSTRGTAQGQQAPMAESKEILPRIGAVQLHIDPAHAYLHLRRHLQELQAHTSRRGPVKSVPAKPSARNRSTSR